MSNSRYRIAKDLVGIARRLVAWRDKLHNPVRREKSVVDKQVNEGIDEYFDDSYGEEDENREKSSQFMCIRNVYSEEEAEVIYDQYVKAMSRGSNYLGDVYSWVLSEGTQVIESEDGDYVVGFRCGSAFVLSHFAPRTLSSGTRFLQKLSMWGQSVIASVLPKQAGMLERLGFKKVGEIPQWFNGVVETKSVMVNHATSGETLKNVLSVGTGKSWVVILLACDEYYSIEEVVSLLDNEKTQNEFLAILGDFNQYKSFISYSRLWQTMECIASKMRGTEFLKKCVELADEKFSANMSWKKIKSRYLL